MHVRRMEEREERKEGTRTNVRDGQSVRWKEERINVCSGQESACRRMRGGGRGSEGEDKCLWEGECM